MEFVTYELSVKLKEKGFICKYPIAMYNEDGEFYPLYTSTEFYYCINDFDEHDLIAPTISQVLQWLRKTYKLFISPGVIADYQDDFHRDTTYWSFVVVNIENGDSIYREYERVTENRFDSYEQAALAGIEYTLNILI